MAGDDHYVPRRRPDRSTIRVRGIDCNVTRWGKTVRPNLVYLHGWGDTGEGFQFVVDALPDDWDIIAPDWRGFGRSGHNDAAYWFPDYLADLDQLIDALGLEVPVKLIGHSMGANVAGLYAGAIPERVSHFVNVEGFGLRDSDPEEAPGRYRAWLQQSRQLPRFREFANLDALATHIRKRSPKLSVARSRYVAALWALQTDSGVRLRADPRHKLPNPVLYRRAEAAACWRAITAETLLVSGADSEIHRAVHAETAPAGAFVDFPAARTLTIDGVGHMLHFEAPQALADAIDSFLRR